LAVLIVDDDPLILRALQRELRDQPLRVEAESDPLAALDRMQPDRYAVVISDQQMPGMTGIELLARVRSLAPETVRVLLTGHADMETTVRAINEGEIHRFIQKPWQRNDLLRHVALAVERHEELRQRNALSKLLLVKNDELSGLNAELRRMAQCDPLTGLFNRGEFDLQLQRQIKLFGRDRQPFSLLMADIDDFKRINDTHGHPAGDEVIRTAAALLRRALREEVDSAYRYGGEEFAVLMRNTTAANGTVAAERILGMVRNASVPAAGTQLRFTLSLGLGQYGADETAQAFLGRVDGALYEAKREGKDRLCAAQSPPSAP
jgi:diguanylate cyclase (GGDEF)-like protein